MNPKPPESATPAMSMPAAEAPPATAATTEPAPASPEAAAVEGDSPEVTGAAEAAVEVLEPVETAALADAPAQSDAAATSAPDPTPPPAPQPKAPELSPAACAAALAQQFPALFGAGVLLPVKLRIQTDIQQRAPHTYSRKALSLFLHRHTTSTPYIRALLAAPHRFDLDGQPAGEISEEHRAAAVAEMERRKAIVQERRAAERQNQRAQQAPRAPQQAPVSSDGAAQAGVDGLTAESPVAAPPQRPPRPPRPAGGRPPRQDDGQHRAQGPGAPRPQGRPGTPPAEARSGPRQDAHPTGQTLGQPNVQPSGQRNRRPEGRPEPRPGAHGDASRPRRDHETAAPSNPAATTPVTSTGDPAADAARRERSALLRTFESSTLTKSNFLVLKRMTEADLDAQLALARQERQQNPQALAQHNAPQRPPQHQPPRDSRPGRR